jgi:hypothetical protein
MKMGGDISTRAAAVALATALLFATSGAHAQKAANATQADALFTRAKKLADVGQMAAACPIFAESYKLDPTAVGVLFYMGACHESTGKIATAWTTFREARDAARRNRQQDRVKIADARIAALEPRVPRLRLVLPPDAAEQGWIIRRDDVVLSSTAWETEIPVDPGMCKIEVLAPGHRPYATTALLLEGATTKVEIPALEPDVIPLRGIPVSERSRPPSPPPPEELDRGSWTSMHTAALAVGGVGVVGVAIGTAFGVAAASDWSDADERCATSGSPRRCDAAGIAAHEDATSKATVSTTAFVLGGAAVATGVVLWLVAPPLDRQPSSDLALADGPGDLGLGLRRSF